MDEYRAWLQEQVDYWRGRCMENAAERGYPGKWYAVDPTLKEILYAYDDCLGKLEELAPSPAPSTLPGPDLG